MQVTNAFSVKKRVETKVEKSVPPARRASHDPLSHDPLSVPTLLGAVTLSFVHPTALEWTHWDGRRPCILG